MGSRCFATCGRRHTARAGLPGGARDLRCDPLGRARPLGRRHLRGSRDCPQDGHATGLDATLLRALAAFEVVKESGEDAFELTCVGECLRAESASSVRPLILMYGSDHARQMFGCLQECVATGKSAFEIAFGSANGFQYFDSHPGLADVFNNGMSAASAFTGPAIASAYSFAGRATWSMSVAATARFSGRSSRPIHTSMARCSICRR